MQKKKKILQKHQLLLVMIVLLALFVAHVVAGPPYVPYL